MYCHLHSFSVFFFHFASLIVFFSFLCLLMQRNRKTRGFLFPSSSFSNPSLMFEGSRSISIEEDCLLRKKRKRFLSRAFDREFFDLPSYFPLLSFLTTLCTLTCFLFAFEWFLLFFHMFLVILLHSSLELLVVLWTRTPMREAVAFCYTVLSISLFSVSNTASMCQCFTHSSFPFL